MSNLTIIIERASMVTIVDDWVIGAILAIFFFIVSLVLKYIYDQITKIGERTIALAESVSTIKKEVTGPIRIMEKETTAMNVEINSIKNQLSGIQQNSLFSAYSSQSFLTIMTSEWEFWEKLFRKRKDKILIATEISNEYIKEYDQVILDSGTTVDQIPRLLNQRFLYVGETIPLKVYTNNLIAAISVVPPQIRVILLNGEIDKVFGATYNKSKIAEPLDEILNATKIILAATYITYEGGPMVSHSDSQNIEFKNALINKKSVDPCTIIIAADWTKFIDIPPPTHRYVSDIPDPLTENLTSKNWDKVKNNNTHLLCITEPPVSNTSDIAKTARIVINKFRENEQTNKGIKVVVCKWKDNDLHNNPKSIA
jgi:DeoR/GlpR family transcriptional regulator of sugar metabolism